MSAHSSAFAQLGLERSVLRDAAAPLALGILVLGLMFHEEATAAVEVWNASTAYNHCWFVLPIALYIAWDRRHGLAGLQVRPLPWLGLLAIPGVVAWMAAERLGIMEGRQLVAMSFVQLLFLVVLGWRLWWALSAAFLYLYFMVPFGAFLTPWLQSFTLDFSLIGLTVIGIPFYADEFLIETPSGRYFVAEACAGLRFLIASIAFGVLYSMLIYRSYTRRAAFILASIVIPIIANGFRALGIIVLGSVLGSAEAAAADHILYGWVFFSIVILLLIAAGMPFREDQAPAAPAPATPEAPRPGARWQAGLATLLVVGIAASAASASAYLDSRAQPVAAFSAPRLVDAAGCTASGAPTLMPPGTEGARDPLGARAVQEFACGPVSLTVTLQAFSTRTNPEAILLARRDLAREDVEDMEFGSLAVPGGSPERWRLAIGGKIGAMTATALWIEGQPSRGGLGERILQARNSVRGAQAAPVLMAVAMHFPRSPLSSREREVAQKLLAAFLAAQPDLGGQVAAIAHAAAGG
jgi:exosortase A